MSAARNKQDAAKELPGERFEVRKDGRVVAYTEYASCYPIRERRDELRKAGYKLYLGGKAFREGKQ